METVVRVIVIIGFIYAVCLLINTVLKVKKVGKVNCSFRMIPSKICFHSLGILLAISASLTYWCRGNEGWLPFLCLAIIDVVHFVDEGIEIKSR